MKTNITFLSLGPGDPELLTLKAVRILREADVVIVPASARSSRAASIVGEWCAKERIETFRLPMSEQREAVVAVYDEMARRIQVLYGQKLQVVVAVEGDVSIYASVHYVLERLQTQGIPVVQVAGVPSFIAAAADATLSLVSQDQRLVVIPGNADVEALSQLLLTNHVVVVMKLSKCQEAVKELLAQRHQTVCHYFENVGTPDGYHTTERDRILERQMPYFSLCVLFPC